MSEYNNIVAVNNSHQFPQPVIDALFSREELRKKVVVENDRLIPGATTGVLVDSKQFRGGVVGGNYRSSWMTFDANGDPSESFLSKVSNTNKNATAYVDARENRAHIVGANYRSSVVYVKYDKKFSDKKVWTHYGDSLTRGGSPEALAGLTGYKHWNGGISGNISAQVAIRSGGAEYFVKVDGNRIPSSGGSVRILSHYPVNIAMAHSWLYLGSLDGVNGHIQYDGSNYNFTSAEGSGKAVSGWVRFIPSPNNIGPAGTMYGHSLIIGVGRNDLNTGVGVDTVICNIRKVIESSSADILNYLIWEIPPWKHEVNGTEHRRKYEEYNNRIANAFPGNFVRVAEFLRTEEAFSVTSTTMTDEDRSDIAKGLTPKSFRRDNDGHFNDAGNRAWAYFMKKQISDRGWLYE